MNHSIASNIRRLELQEIKENSVALTARIQQSIDEVMENGSGTVIIGTGTWIITTLFLRSGLRLHLEQGAVLESVLK